MLTINNKEPGQVAYRKLALDLEQAIRSGRLKAGERLPAELTMVAEYGLSRTTVRQAIKELEKQSLVHRRRGSGTFVSPNPGRAWATRSSFMDFVKDHGERIRREVLECRWESASDALSAELGLEYGAEVMFFRRLDWLDSVPMAVDEGWVVIPYANNLSRSDLAEFDFMGVWARRQSSPIRRTAMELRADAADKQLAAFLEVKVGSPVFVEDADYYTAEGAACRMVTVYRHDQYSFRRVFLHDETTTENITGKAARH